MALILVVALVVTAATFSNRPRYRFLSHARLVFNEHRFQVYEYDIDLKTVSNLARPELTRDGYRSDRPNGFVNPANGNWVYLTPGRFKSARFDIDDYSVDTDKQRGYTTVSFSQWLSDTWIDRIRDLTGI